jgi:hypothetical protein
MPSLSIDGPVLFSQFKEVALTTLYRQANLGDVIRLPGC